MAKNLTKEHEKGKYFLVNDTFVRVDGSDWVNIQANIGHFRSIEVTTGAIKALIHRPFCEGYVISPGLTTIWHPKVNKRCMSEKELQEAREDHYFLRQSSFLQKSLWLEYWHSTGTFGQTHSDKHIQAFNEALHEKRQQYRKDHPKATQEEILKATYDQAKADGMFETKKLG